MKFFRSFLLSIIFLAGMLSAPAAILTSVPMQGPMAHAYLGWNESANSLFVLLDPAIPQLIPLAISHPGDSFASDAPWFASLDPSQEGAAFSRRWGFVASGDTDLLPDGAFFWLRLTSIDSGLNAVLTNTWTDMFVDGPDNTAWRYNGTMYHPTFFASAGIGNYSAGLELYLGDSAGVQIAGVAAIPFALQFTAVPEPSSLALLVLGTAVAVLRRRKR